MEAFCREFDHRHAGALYCDRVADAGCLQRKIRGMDVQTHAGVIVSIAQWNDLDTSTHGKNNTCKHHSPFLAGPRPPKRPASLSARALSRDGAFTRLHGRRSEDGRLWGGCGGAVKTRWTRNL